MTESQRKNAESQRKLTDREKVIKAVECRKNAQKRCGNPCERTGWCEYAAWVRDPDGEPYYPCYCDTEKLCDDILLLLREQEPDETRLVHHYSRPGVYADLWLYCEKCGGKIDDGRPYRPKFCPECGRKVKWE